MKKIEKNKIVIVLSMMIFLVLSCTPNKKPIEQPEPPIEVVEPEPYIGNIEIGTHNVKDIKEVDDLVWFQWEKNENEWIYSRLQKRHVTFVYGDTDTPTIEFRRNVGETMSENLILAIIITNQNN